MQIVVPPELLAICNRELSEYVKISFTKFDGGEGVMYFADHFSIKESNNEVWEQARKIQHGLTRLTIEQVLQILAQNGGVVVTRLNDEKRHNNELIADACCLAVSQYIRRSLDKQIADGII